MIIARTPDASLFLLLLAWIVFAGNAQAGYDAIPANMPRLEGFPSQAYDPALINPGNHRLAQAPVYGYGNPRYAPGRYPGAAMPANPRATWPTTQQQPRVTSQPRVETSISQTTLYPQESVLYSIKVFSDGNVKTIDIVFPKVPEVGIETLVYGKNRELSGGGQHRFVTEFSYALTPLQAGEIMIPPVKVKGVLRASQGTARLPYGSAGDTPFEIEASQQTTLEVKQALAEVQPWLAAKSLRIRNDLGKQKEVQAGDPITMTITTEGLGITARHLPAIGEMLDGNGYKLYRETSELETRMTADQQDVSSRRTERFTLVPVQGGRLHLPRVRIAWWNTDQDKMKTAVLAAPVITVTGNGNDIHGSETGPTSQPDHSETNWLAFSIAMVLISLPFLIYWLVAWLRDNGLWEKAKAAMPKKTTPAPAQGTKPSRRKKLHLSPLYHLRQLQYGLVQKMPASHKIWYCVQRLDVEEEPEDWCQMFQLYTSRHLGLPVNSPIPQIAEKLLQSNPRIRPERLRALTHEMDDCRYGGEAIDFKRWKRKFRKETRPPLLPLWRLRRKKRSKLPSLNPDKA